jgi:hypothetical protein
LALYLVLRENPVLPLIQLLLATLMPRVEWELARTLPVSPVQAMLLKYRIRASLRER